MVKRLRSLDLIRRQQQKRALKFAVARARLKAPKTRELTQAEIELIQKREQEKLIQEGANKTQQLIDSQKKTIADLQAYKQRVESRVYTGTGDPTDFNESKARTLDNIDRNISFAERYISEYQKAQSLVKTGITFESAIAQAEAQAQGYKERVELRTISGVSPTTAKTSSQIKADILGSKLLSGKIDLSAYKKSIAKLPMSVKKKAEGIEKEYERRIEELNKKVVVSFRVQKDLENRLNFQKDVLKRAIKRGDKEAQTKARKEISTIEKSLNKIGGVITGLKGISNIEQLEKQRPDILKQMGIISQTRYKELQKEKGKSKLEKKFKQTLEKTVKYLERKKEELGRERLGLRKEINKSIKERQDIVQGRKEAPTSKGRLKDLIENEKKYLEDLHKSLEKSGITALETTIDYTLGLIGLPSAIKEVYKNPSLLKKIPSALKREVKDIVYLGKVAPDEALVKVGTEILLMEGTGKAISKLSRSTTATLTKFSPKYVGKAKIGKTLTLATGKGKTVKLKVVGKIPKESIKSQLKKSGKRVTAISSQADELLGVIRGKRVIRKPIPKEAKFSKATKSLLKKFDKGTITKKELITLDTMIKKEGAKGILERSFFADPSGKIRPSRLGVVQDQEGGILDILSGDVTFKKPKPQILLFEDIKIQKLPKSFNTIKRKLAQRKPLTARETSKLLEFQLKQSGKFKPLGFATRESELTLAPNEIIKKVKTVGVTIVNGKRVPIIKAVVYKPKGKIKSLLAKLKKGKLTKKQIKQLDRLLKKKTGFNYKLSSSTKIGKKYVSIKRIGLSTLPKFTKGRISKVTPSKKLLSKKTISKKITSKKVLSKKALSRKVISKSLSKYGSSAKTISRYLSRAKSKKSIYRYLKRKGVSPKKIRSYIRKYYKSPQKIFPPYSPPKTPKKTRTPIIPPKKLKTIKILRKERKLKRKTAYAILEKRGGKFYKLNVKPLSKQDAKDKLAYRLDNRISRTAKIIPIGKVKRLGSIRNIEKGYFRKHSKYLRNYKIVKGKRIRTPNTYIEKRGKATISTRGEKRQLRLNLLKKRKVRKMRKVRKRVTRKNSIKKIRNQRIGLLKKKRKNFNKKRIIKRKFTKRRKPIKKKVRRRRYNPFNEFRII